MQGNPREPWIPDSTLWIPDSVPMDSGFQDPKVAGFQVLVSNTSFVLCFPNEITSITGMLLKGKNERTFLFLPEK